jgi:hypothetical protein
MHQPCRKTTEAHHIEKTESAPRISCWFRINHINLFLALKQMFPVANTAMGILHRMTIIRGKIVADRV